MCGRYTVTIDKSTLEKRFGGKFYIAQPSYDWTPTYNAAPSQMLPIIRTHRPNTIELATWGFWPEDWKRTRHLRPQINARLETAVLIVCRAFHASPASRFKQPEACPHCGGHNLTRRGTRKKKLEIVQLWRCASCKRTITPGPAALRNKTYPLRMILSACTISSFFLRVPRRVTTWLPQSGHASGIFDECGARAARGIGIGGASTIYSRAQAHEFRVNSSRILLAERRTDAGGVDMCGGRICCLTFAAVR